MNGKSKKRKNVNKILKNSYYDSKNLKGDEYQLNDGVDVNRDYAETYMKSSYNSESSRLYEKTRNKMMRLLRENEEISNIVDSSVGKKFNKAGINKIFEISYEYFKNDAENSEFFNVAYLFDVISKVTGLKVRNLFDLLDMEYKEILIEELDKTYDILDGGNKMY